MSDQLRNRSVLAGAALSVCLIAAAGPVVIAQYSSAAEHASIAYSKSTPTDVVARLQASVDRGDTVLDFDPDTGYLRAVLRALNVPVSSQSLVFSRTSLQVDRIAPWSPRALYFNDHVYVGYAQNGPIMEIASVDPKLGAVFYTVNQQSGAPPSITRPERACSATILRRRPAGCPASSCDRRLPTGMGIRSSPISARRRTRRRSPIGGAAGT
jgi:hypothetical protein